MINYGFELDLNNHVVGPHQSKPYRLYAVTNHLGTLKNGHFTATCRHGDEWFHCNDSNVTPLQNNITNIFLLLLFHKLRLIRIQIKLEIS